MTPVLAILVPSTPVETFTSPIINNLSQIYTLVNINQNATQGNQFSQLKNQIAQQINLLEAAILLAEEFQIIVFKLIIKLLHKFSPGI